ncbi:hypothetical protein ACFV19_01150 [Streptomyces griseoluteus]|uniref:hypothetical protein n=1 Tax=Streptomyces griseoluteus TaxID=29306 RepID=UPI003688966F
MLPHPMNISNAAAPGLPPEAVNICCLFSRTEPGWNEPVSTALLGNWADPPQDQGHLTPDALKKSKSEAGVIDRQLTPVWRRKTGQARLLLLDAPLSGGPTLDDLARARTATDTSRSRLR